MTSFFLLAALLVAAAVAILLSGPIGARAKSVRESDLRATNVSLARERQRELRFALDSAAITADEFEAESARLERDLAAELEALPEREARDGSRAIMLLVILFVPVAAGALYLHLGDPGAITRDSASAAGSEPAAPATASQSAAGQSAAQAPALAELLPRLEERLAREPDDIDGWRLLGRSYLGVEEFKRAESALRRAVGLDENDADTLSQLAEAIAMGRGGELAGEPVELLEKALVQDAAHPQGLWLRAISLQQTGEHEAALARFEQLRAVIPNDAAALETVDDMMARSQAEPGIPADVAEPGVTASNGRNEADGETDARGEGGESGEITDTAAVTVSIDLADAARADVTADNTVFIYARATEGPPMPLAVARYTVRDLPLTVTLDESMAMLPAMSLANFDSVTIGARISTTGEAIAATGDWFAEQHDVSVGSDDPIELLIGERQP